MRGFCTVCLEPAIKPHRVASHTISHHWGKNTSSPIARTFSVEACIILLLVRSKDLISGINFGDQFRQISRRSDHVTNGSVKINASTVGPVYLHYPNPRFVSGQALCEWALWVHQIGLLYVNMHSFFALPGSLHAKTWCANRQVLLYVSALGPDPSENLKPGN